VLGRIVVTLAYNYAAGRKRTVVTRLLVKDVPAGATVRARCAKGCARKQIVKRDARGAVALTRLITKPLKAGTVIRVTVSKPGYIAAVKSFRVRRGKPPRVRTRCLPPGAAEAQACGS
jgi:hypothetical protein